MNAVRILVVVTLSPLMVVGAALYLCWRGIAAGWAIAADALESTNPFPGGLW